MAKYVLISIPDNAVADAFVQALKDDNVLFATPSTDEDRESIFQEVKWDNLEGQVIEAIWQKPTLYCECPIRYTEGKSKKYGWYVCTNCSKPRKGSMQHPYDLSRPGVPPQEIPYYLGFRADGRGWRIPKEPKK